MLLGGKGKRYISAICYLLCANHSGTSKGKDAELKPGQKDALSAPASCVCTENLSYYGFSFDAEWCSVGAGS